MGWDGRGGGAALVLNCLTRMVFLNVFLVMLILIKNQQMGKKHAKLTSMLCEICV